MGAVPTVLVKEGKDEKVVNLEDFENDQKGDKKYTLVATPEVSAVEFDPNTVSASSGQHAAIQSQLEYAKAAAAGAIAVPAMANVSTDEEDEDANVLETVVDATNLPKDLPAVKTPEEIAAEAEAASASVETAAQDAQADAGNGRRGGRK